MTTFKKSLAVATVAAAAFALPGTAMAGDYRKCKDTEATVAGGLIGGSLGTILGEEIAGRGDRTEGAIAGAIIGGVIGAAIGDGASDCEKDGRIYRDGRVISSQARQTSFQTVQYNRGHAYNHRDTKRNYGNRNRGFGQGYNARQHDRDLRRIERRMDRLRTERRQLKDRRNYERGRWINRRLNEIAYELDHLKDERRRVKRQWDRSRQSRNYRNNNRQYNRRGHYHGQSLCYSVH